MARYTEESVDRVRDAIDMADLVGSRTELRRSSAGQLQALCPFHDERTPSFSVDPVKKLYHCFGCGVGGDGIKFVQELEGLQFVEALELLADRYGIELEPEAEDPQEAARRERRGRLMSLLDRTTSYYERVLWEAGEAANARSYLLSRGLSEEALRAFRVGYSPSAWDRVLMASRKTGFSNQELFDGGLAVRGREGRLYDRFRGRIMFPLADARGRVVGFGARAMGEDRGPKYLNTSENELFHKGRQVYAAHLARASAAREGRVIVVEGYTDVIALWQAGFPNAVAIMGTSLTEPQVDVLRRLAPVALLALDSDNAGQEAMVRAARVAAGKNLELRVVPLPAGADPADLLARDGGADEVRDLLGKSVPFVRFRVDRELARGDTMTAEGKDAILAALGPVFGAVPASVLREELLRIVADRLDIDPSLATRLLAGLAALLRAPLVPTASSPRRPLRAGRRSLPAACRSPSCSLAPTSRSAGSWPSASPRAPVGPRRSRPSRRRSTSPRRCCSARPSTCARTSPTRPRPCPRTTRKLAALVAELVARASAEPASSAELKAQRLQLEFRRIDRRLRAAKAAGEAGITALAAERQQVSAQLRDAIAQSVDSA